MFVFLKNKKLELSLWRCGVRIYAGHHVDKPLVDVYFGISTSEQKRKQPLEQALCCVQQTGVPALMDVYHVSSCSKQRRDHFSPPRQIHF